MTHSLALAVCCLLSGKVHTTSGRPIAGAVIDVRGQHTPLTRTDAQGTFRVALARGTYDLSVLARGFSSVHVVNVRVVRDVTLDVALQALDSPHTRTIAVVHIDGRLQLSRSAIPTTIIERSAYQKAGYDRVIDGLSEVPSVTFTRPDGGSSTGPTVVSLRGPDPSETLVTLDGQLLNDGNTGDLDLSQLPIAAFSGVDVTEGLGPQDRLGSNTIGGSVNLVSLQPTVKPRVAASLSGGSFGQSEGWSNASGFDGHLGYAFALADHQEVGSVNQNALLCNASLPLPCANAPSIHLGSTISTRAFLANMRYDFSQSADIGLRIFNLGDVRDESGLLNAPLAGTNGFIGVGPAMFAQNLRAYMLHARNRLGAGSLQTSLSLSNDTVGFSGTAGASPYDLSHQDARNTLNLAWTRAFARTQFSLGAGVRGESLLGTGIAPTQTQTIRTLSLSGGLRPHGALSLDAGIYWTSQSTFGSNLDGRFAASDQIARGQILRFSLGTGFRAPLLIEKYLFPLSALPPPNADNVIVGQGNPNERPEYATEFELGYARRFDPRTTLDVSLYRTNLRDPIENYYPIPNPRQVQFSYPINVGNVVYEGAEIKLHHAFTHLFVSAGYGLNIAYPLNLPLKTVSNPTSGSTLVNGEQFIGIPQQVGSLGLDYQSGVYHAAIDTVFRGKHNELNQGPFAFVTAGIGRTFGRFDVTLAATNLTNAVAGSFSGLGQGVPYYGVIGTNSDGSLAYGNLPTNRLYLEPTSLRLIVTIR